VERALGFELAPPHRWVRHGEWTSYWIGPATRLLYCERQVDGYEAERDALLAAGGALFDVSDARVVLHATAEALGKGCGLDFHPSVFPAGECRSTLLARVSVLIARGKADLLVLVPRSYAESLRSWLA
jgi:sarcosine oxidase subunit gamma